VTNVSVSLSGRKHTYKRVILGASGELGDRSRRKLAVTKFCSEL